MNNYTFLVNYRLNHKSFLIGDVLQTDDDLQHLVDSGVASVSVVITAPSDVKVPAEPEATVKAKVTRRNTSRRR